MNTCVQHLSSYLNCSIIDHFTTKFDGELPEQPRIEAVAALHDKLLETIARGCFQTSELGAVNDVLCSILHECTNLGAFVTLQKKRYDANAEKTIAKDIGDVQKMRDRFRSAVRLLIRILTTSSKESGSELLQSREDLANRLNFNNFYVLSY